jgi:hypothetical protein
MTKYNIVVTYELPVACCNEKFSLRANIEGEDLLPPVTPSNILCKIKKQAIITSKLTQLRAKCQIKKDAGDTRPGTYHGYKLSYRIRTARDPQLQ